MNQGEVQNEPGPAAKDRLERLRQRGEQQRQGMFSTGAELGPIIQGKKLTAEQKLQQEALGQAPGAAQPGVSVEEENKRRVLQKQLRDMVEEAKEKQSR